MLRLRHAQGNDLSLLRMVLLEAVYWRPGVPRPPLERALADPEVARYVEGFGRPGDFGVVAEESSEPLGAAWWRYFDAAAPGYGFVDETIPEISAAVFPAHRRRGVGTALLTALRDEARNRGIDRLSLSVERANPSTALYERLGFWAVGCQENALTMIMSVRE